MSNRCLNSRADGDDGFELRRFPARTGSCHHRCRSHGCPIPARRLRYCVYDMPKAQVTARVVLGTARDTAKVLVESAKQAR